MRVLIGCEFSGIVRRAFTALGHDAWSCDLLPAMDGGNHLLGDVEQFLDMGWDAAVFHPPCTFLNTASVWCLKNPWGKLKFPGRDKKQGSAVEFVKRLWAAPIPRVAIENPQGQLSTLWQKPSQSIQPYQFGEDASKTTCLWLRGLPPLRSTRYTPPRLVVFNGKICKRWGNQTDSGQNRLGPTEDRWALRSLTYPGIAAAMAEQWGDEAIEQMRVAA